MAQWLLEVLAIRGRNAGATSDDVAPALRPRIAILLLLPDKRHNGGCAYKRGQRQGDTFIVTISACAVRILCVSTEVIESRLNACQTKEYRI